jgi:hypothetical protein
LLGQSIWVIVLYVHMLNLDRPFSDLRVLKLQQHAQVGKHKKERRGGREKMKTD